jgi:xylan 1,4-beta-xylosidase
VELGCSPIKTKDDIEYLKAASIPRIQKKILYTENNSLIIIAKLEPYEVRLLELTPYNEFN